MVVDHGEDAGHDPVAEESFPDLHGAGQLLEDEQVPLLVVLLMTARLDLREHAPGCLGTLGRVGHGDVPGVLPGLVRDPGQHLKDLELGDRPGPPVDEVDGAEKGAGGCSVPEPRAGQGPVLEIPEFGSRGGRSGGRRVWRLQRRGG